MPEPKMTGGPAIRSSGSAPKGPMTRRGMIFHPTLGYAIPPPIPLSVARRNARERSRVKTVNSSFECLRIHVPAAARNKKMSKVREVSIKVWLGLRKCPRYVIGTDQSMARIKKLSKVCYRY